MRKFNTSTNIIPTLNIIYISNISDTNYFFVTCFQPLKAAALSVSTTFSSTTARVQSHKDVACNILQLSNESIADHMVSD
jgi:hypothetical protein